MFYEYVIDNNEYYAEDSHEISIFSTEEISAVEFENIIKDAFQLCDIKDYSSVARKVLEIDDRFFLPKFKSVAFIGEEEGDYDRKIRGFHHK